MFSMKQGKRAAASAHGQARLAAPRRGLGSTPHDGWAVLEHRHGAEVAVDPNELTFDDPSTAVFGSAHARNPQLSSHDWPMAE